MRTTSMVSTRLRNRTSRGKSANTAFADFPRLSSILARDSVMPLVDRPIVPTDGEHEEHEQRDGDDDHPGGPGEELALDHDERDDTGGQRACSPGTVKSTLSDARHRLKELLDG